MDDEQDKEKRGEFWQRRTLEGLELMPTYLKISQLLLLQYDEFLELVNKFNRTLKSFTDDEPDYIEFSVVPESDTTMLWKLFVRIKCSRISRTDQSVSDTANLSLNQFLSVHQSLTQQMLAFRENSSASAAAATTQLFNRSLSTGRLSFPAFDTDQCCICMENQTDLVLPCTHKICNQCFKQWSAQASAASARATCPICRSEINIDADFVLADAPEKDALKKAIKESILEIPKDGKKYE